MNQPTVRIVACVLGSALLLQAMGCCVVMGTIGALNDAKRSHALEPMQWYGLEYGASIDVRQADGTLMRTRLVSTEAPTSTEGGPNEPQGPPEAICVNDPSTIRIQRSLLRSGWQVPDSATVLRIPREHIVEIRRHGEHLGLATGFFLGLLIDGIAAALIYQEVSSNVCCD